MSPSESMSNFLMSLGCRRREDIYILDEFDHEFYLRFDATDDPDTPNFHGTCDIYLAPVGSHPKEVSEHIRAVCNCTRSQVMRFMFALGVSRFSEATRKVLYESNSVIRAQ